MEYCLLQYDTLKFFLGSRVHGGSLPNFNFFSVTSRIFQQNCKIHHSDCQDTNFTTFLTLVREFVDVEIITNARF